MNVLKLDPRKLANQTDNVDINVGVCEHFLGKLHGYIEAALNNNLFLGIECINMWHRGFSVEGAALYVIRSAITEAYRNNLDDGVISDEVYEPLVNEFKSRLVSIPDWCDYYNIMLSSAETVKPAEEVQAIFLRRIAERDELLEIAIKDSNSTIQRYKAPRIRLCEHDSRLNDIYHPDEAALIGAYRFDIKRTVVTLFNNTYSSMRV